MIRSPNPGPSIQTARTFHAFILASTCIVLAGAFVVTRSTGTVTTSLGTLDAVALFTGLSSFTIASVVRQRLPGTGGAGPDAWWQEHLGRAVLIWSVLEMPAIVGAMTLFATRHTPAFVALGLVAIASLVRLRPSRLARP